MLSNKYVSDLHHVHVWSLDGERDVMTVHLVLVGDVSIENVKALKTDVQRSLKKYDFEHTTVEFEFDNEQCRDEPSCN